MHYIWRSTSYFDNQLVQFNTHLKQSTWFNKYINKLRTQMQNTNTLKKEEKYFYQTNVWNFYKNTKVRKCWLVPRAKMNFFNSGSGLLFGWLNTRNKYKAVFNNPVCKKKIFNTKKQKWRESNSQTIHWRERLKSGSQMPNSCREEED